jgi:hypothetical protein
MVYKVLVTLYDPKIIFESREVGTYSCQEFLYVLIICKGNRKMVIDFRSDSRVECLILLGTVSYDTLMK